MWLVENLGVGTAFQPYEATWDMQRKVHRAVVDGQRPDTLLLLEHEAVYTAGKRTELAEYPQDGTPVVPVDRGGKITWHGPGQLVGYPIVRLAEPVDVVAHVRRLEQLLIAAIAELGLESHQVDGRSGVWVGERGAENKIAAIGIRVAEGTTMHGFALNCCNDLAPFENIIACGIRDAGVTTLSHELGRQVSPVEAMSALLGALAASEGIAA